MSEKKCFLNTCTATVGDCENLNCPCLKCLGKDKETCKKLCDDKEFLKQQLYCSRCKNYETQK